MWRNIQECRKYTTMCSIINALTINWKCPNCSRHKISSKKKNRTIMPHDPGCLKLIWNEKKINTKQWNQTFYHWFVRNHKKP